jgi:hypothetical protein
MMESALYDFVYRGLLTDEALDYAGRRSTTHLDHELPELADALNYELLDADELDVGTKMGVVYAAITAFERSARRFVARVLQNEHGEDWWEQCVSKNIRDFAESRREEENTIKWHGTRGDDPLTFTELSHLPKIIQQNWDDFEPYMRRIDWATALFSTVIMHSGTLDIEDIERLGMNIRDWVKQIG